MMSTRDRLTVLHIAPVSMTGGMATSAKNIINSKALVQYDFIILDVTGYGAKHKSNIFLGVFYQIYLFCKLVLLLVLKNPKLVHVHMASFLYFYRRSADILICKLFGKKIIIHLRGAKFVEFYEDSGSLGKGIIKFVLKASDRIIVLSEYWAQFLSSITGHGKIVVIPNGVECGRFLLVNDKREELGLSEDHVIAVFMGPLGKRKGAFDILKAIPRVTGKFRNIVFIFCGNEEFKGELKLFQEELADRKLEPYVKYVGEITGQNKYDYYLSSDIFILPSYAENLPNTLLEAMAAGLPVVVSSVGAVPEIVEDGTNGFLFKPGDIGSIAENIEKLAGDRVLRQAMGAKNLKLAKEKYDMSVVGAKISNLYRELSEPVQ